MNETKMRTAEEWAEITFGKSSEFRGMPVSISFQRKDYITFIEAIQADATAAKDERIEQLTTENTALKLIVSKKDEVLKSFLEAYETADKFQPHEFEQELSAISHALSLTPADTLKEVQELRADKERLEALRRVLKDSSARTLSEEKQQADKVKWLIELPMTDVETKIFREFKDGYTQFMDEAITAAMKENKEKE